MKYAINDIYPCIQGEGVNTGVPMILVRLQGCAVGCPWCDTKETWETDPENEAPHLDAALGTNPLYAKATPGEVAAYLTDYWPELDWVLLTGGEPAQHNLKGLVEGLHNRGYKVALETSGTAKGHINAGVDWVCCSPKVDMPGGKHVLPEAVALADEITWPVGKVEDIEDLLGWLEDFREVLKPAVEIGLQPLSQSEKATALCVEEALARGWRLSAQVHKYLGLR